ncbi:hypothetical protein ACLMJK_004865 [Lecanora helva]
MAENNKRVFYLNDTKGQVRINLNLQSEEKDEDFFGFEVLFDLQSKWDDLDSTVAIAQPIIREMYRERKLKLGVSDAILDDLSEWKLYQLHKAAKKRGNRSKKPASHGNDNQQIGG